MKKVRLMEKKYVRHRDRLKPQSAQKSTIITARNNLGNSKSKFNKATCDRPDKRTITHIYVTKSHKQMERRKKNMIYDIY